MWNDSDSEDTKSVAKRRQELDQYCKDIRKSRRERGENRFVDATLDQLQDLCPPGHDLQTTHSRFQSIVMIKSAQTIEKSNNRIWWLNLVLAVATVVGAIATGLMAINTFASK